MNKIRKSITVEQALEAFETTGLKPVYGEFTRIDNEGNKCGCLITALVCASGKMTFEEFANVINSPDDIFADVVEMLDLPEGFDLEKLYEGFDKLSFRTDSPEYKLGYEIREELQKRGMIA